MKRTLGEMLQERIIEKNISRVDLCRGLCSPSVLTKYLSGERRMDRLLLTALIQRMGLSPDKFVTLLTENEYIYFDWRQRIAMAQMDRDWKGVLAFLEGYIFGCVSEEREKVKLYPKVLAGYLTRRKSMNPLSNC